MVGILGRTLLIIVIGSEKRDHFACAESLLLIMKAAIATGLKPGTMILQSLVYTR